MLNQNNIKGEVMKLNKGWHQKNKMTVNPTLDERINWHIAHSKNCSCREIPDSIRKEINKREVK